MSLLQPYRRTISVELFGILVPRVCLTTAILTPAAATAVEVLVTAAAAAGAGGGGASNAHWKVGVECPL